MCPAAVGPGLDAPGLFDEFETVTAANVRNSERMTGTDLDLLNVLVGTLKDGSGEEFVERLLAMLGPGGNRGTARIDDWNMRFIDLRPDGPRGWAYGRDDKVVIAYERSQLGPPSHPLIGGEMKEAVGDVLLPNTIGVDPVVESRWGDRLDDAPIAYGSVTDAQNPGWVYFRTGPGVARMSCGINPEGSVVDCDVPDRLYGMPDGTNRIVLDAAGKRYAYAERPMFSRDSPVAWIGERVSNGAASCVVTDQAPMICRIVGPDGVPQRVNMK